MCRKLKFLHPVAADVIFDDYVEQNGDDDPEAYFGWSQICDECLKKLAYLPIEEDTGHGICGVEGCNNEAKHYIDFQCNDIELLEMEKKLRRNNVR